MEAGSLPMELWRLILAYLPLADLGRCCLVCRAWRELVLSLDSTRWRQLCLGCPECRHPNWPRRPQLAPPSWREALRQHALASRTWTQNGAELHSSACLHLFRRRKDRRVWHVGAAPGCGFETLRGALAAAGPYDRVLLHPGVYEEQAEVTLKVPVEIVGMGKLGDVALLVSFDQQCPTARLCNLVFMPAWFSPVVYKTSSGHVQLDNCNFEGCQLHVRGPGTCQARFCSFAQGSSAHFLGVAISLMDSCEFSGGDSASITVEGPPVSERNWACKHLAALAKTLTAVTMATSSGSIVDTASQDTKDSLGGVSHRDTTLGGPITMEDWTKQEVDWETGWTKQKAINGGLLPGQEGTVIEDDSMDTSNESSDEDNEQRGENVKNMDCTLSYEQHGLVHLSDPGLPDWATYPALLSLSAELQRDAEARELASSVQGCLLRRCLLRDGKGGVHLCNHAQARLEANVFRGLNYAVRCIQNAKLVMLRNEVSGCRASGVFLRLSAQGLIAENNIHSNGEAGLDIRKGANPIILCNRIHSGLRSGIVVLGNGKGSIRSNQIYGNKEAGVYILFNGNPVVSGNHIFQGLAAGIAVNENGRGLITENVIRQNQWGGADIRRGGDPILRNNFICHGYSDGVVVGERGRGLIEGNHIYGNRGCGVWVMSSSLPQLIGNYITHNRMYGLAVFCRKDPESSGAGEGYRPAQERERGGGGGGGGGGGERGGQENFHEEGELLAWESDMDSEDERFSSRRPITVALVENNCMSRNGAVGVYVKSSEALNVVGNMVANNRAAGMSIIQSSQLTRLVGNCVHGNGRVGITVDRECRVELRGNGIYGNGCHGICFRGDGQIVENDVVGNGAIGIRVMESADVKVLRNRVQSLRGCAISVREQVRGVVQENLVYQGFPANIKPPIYTNPLNQECVILSNTLLTHRPNTPWALENPPPRPLGNNPPSAASSAHPANLAISMTSRITTTVESGCHNNGSIFCSIL
ncbi:F-box only protein 10 [Colossoma macropomum]|uniref:F-box only protein 10 n=1 Tax=Colossoma macropomum TaxID=42526 RepID=UPI0018643242|nr:F-box only protein 10 [Colossoma macropomum]